MQDSGELRRENARAWLRLFDIMNRKTNGREGGLRRVKGFGGAAHAASLQEIEGGLPSRSCVDWCPWPVIA
jgi:hypothetical protein